MKFLKRFTNMSSTKLPDSCKGYYDVLYDAKGLYYEKDLYQLEKNLSQLERVVSITNPTCNLLAKYNMVFSDMQIVNSDTYKYVVMKNKNLYISVREKEDEYFLVCVKKGGIIISDNFKYYSCDQFDGLEKLFKDIGL